MALELPLLLHPWAGLSGLVAGLPVGAALATAAERLAYDDESFDPAKGPRAREHVRLRELEDDSFLPWQHRIPFLGLLLGMIHFCRFELLAAPAACVDCGRRLPWAERLPVLAYLRLGGRCAGCGGRIPSQYLWMEVVAPLLTGLVLAIHGATLEGLLYSLMAWLCLLASVVDWNYQIIPDEVPTLGVAIGLGVGLAHTLGAVWAGPLPAGGLLEALQGPALRDPWHLGWMASGGLVGGLPLWLLQKLGSWLAGTTAMGGGDVKLGFALGLFLGPTGAGVALFYAAVLGALCGGVVLLVGGGKREQGFTKFAFGPYICLGAVLVSLVGHELAFDVYLGAVHWMVQALWGVEMELE